MKKAGVLKRCNAVTITALSFVILFSQSVFTQNWPQASGSSSRLNYYDTTLTFPLEEYAVGTVSSNIDNLVYYDGIVYTLQISLPHIICAIELASGDELWCREIPSVASLPLFVPAVSDSYVLVGGQGGEGLYALDRLTGDSIWFTQMGSLLTKAPVIDADQVYITTGMNELVCLDISTGEPVWSREDVFSNAIPVVDENYLYYSDFDSAYALHKVSGDVFWSQPINGHLFPSIGLMDSVLFVGNPSQISCFYSESGELKWQVDLADKTLARIITNAFAISPQIMVGKMEMENSDSLYLMAFDNQDGTVVWDKLIHRSSYTSPLILGDQVYDLNRWGFSIDVYDLLTGDSIYSHARSGVFRASPLFAGGSLIVGTSGNIFAYRGGTTTPITERGTSGLSFEVHPQPIHDAARIQLDGMQNRRISLSLISVSGQVVDKIFEGQVVAGSGIVSWSTHHIQPGIYFMKLSASGQSSVRKVIIQ